MEKIKREKIKKICSLEKSITLKKKNSLINSKEISNQLIRTINEIKDKNLKNYKIGDKIFINKKDEKKICKNMNLFFDFFEEKKIVLKKYLTKWKKFCTSNENNVIKDDIFERRNLIEILSDEENKEEFIFVKLDSKNLKKKNVEGNFFLKRNNTTNDYIIGNFKAN